MKFKNYFESKDFSLSEYYTLLDSFLRERKNWHLQKIPDDPYKQYEIVDDEGKRYGKIEREYDPQTRTLFLNHIGVGFDEQGQRMKGLGLTKLIYNFEKDIALKYGIKKICVETVNEITEKEFRETYKDYRIVKLKDKICAILR